MKNKKLLNILIISAAVVITTVLPGFCSPNIPVKQTALKFLLAMGGVVLSSLIIFTGLSIYNKFFVGQKSIKFDKKDTLSTPDNVEDAIDFFIRKNKLR